MAGTTTITTLSAEEAAHLKEHEETYAPIASNISKALFDANISQSWEKFLANDWPPIRDFFTGSWIIPVLTMTFAVSNLLLVYSRTNGLNSIAVSASALKEIIKDIDFGDGFSLYTIFDWVISVTSISG